MLWEKTFGGPEADQSPQVVVCQDGGYLFVAASDADITETKTVPRRYPDIPQRDFWAVKLRPDILTLQATTQSSTSIEANGFQMQLSGPTNQYIVEFTTNLIDWVPFHTNDLRSNAVVIADPGAVDSPRRNYRAQTVVP